ncbi:MAG: hypothetical protein ACLSVD_00605 [Eggerthellaceae bacterium]
MFVIGAYCAPTLFNHSHTRRRRAADRRRHADGPVHAHHPQFSSRQHVHGHRHNMLLLLLGTCCSRTAPIGKSSW